MPLTPRHSPGFEALIASFERQGWSRSDAMFKAAGFRRSFVTGTSDAEILSAVERYHLTVARHEAIRVAEVQRLTGLVEAKREAA